MISSGIELHIEICLREQQSSFKLTFVFINHGIEHLHM